MVKWRSLLVGGAISAFCLFLLLRQVDLSRTAEAFARADAGWLGLSLASIGVALLLRFWRWQLLFLPQNHVRLSSTTTATLIGYMFNTVLPGRVGELVRASLLDQMEGVTTARAVGTIFIEKVLDVLVLLVFLGVLVTLLPLPPEITGAGTKVAVVFGAVAVAFFVASFFRQPLVVWVERVVDPLPLLRRLRPSRLLHLVLDSADGLRRPDLLAIQICLSLALWGIALLTIWLTLKAFGLDLPWTAAALVLVTTNLGMTVPSAPGYIGVYHYIAVQSLRLFGVDESSGLAVAFVLHGVGFGAFTVAGAILLIFGLARQHYTVSDLWRIAPGRRPSDGDARRVAPSSAAPSPVVPAPLGGEGARG
jgi:hypothetical protein